MVQYLSLDQILSAGAYHLRKWSTGLESNKAWRILHYVLCRLWEEGRGHLKKAQLTFAQASLSLKLGLSKRWVNVLCQRLAAAGWLEYSSTKLPDGTNSSCRWRIGPKLTRLLVMLQKSKRKKSAIKPVWNNRAVTNPLSSKESERKKETPFHRMRKEHFASHIEEKESLPLPPSAWVRTHIVPTYDLWMSRGRGNE